MEFMLEVEILPPKYILIPFTEFEKVKKNVMELCFMPSSAHQLLWNLEKIIRINVECVRNWIWFGKSDI